MEDIKIKRKNKRDFASIVKISFIVFLFCIIIFSSFSFFYYSYVYKIDIIKALILIHNLAIIVTTIYIYIRNDCVEYKLNWIIIINLFPILGLLFYYLVGNTKISKNRINKLKSFNEESKQYLNEKFELFDMINDKQVCKNFNYISNMSGYPLYKNEGVRYFETGEKFWNDVITNIKTAKNYILIEFYMISDGDLLDKVLDILFSKAQENIEIKIIVDYLGAKKKIPKYFKEKLEKVGIEVLEFNRNILSLNKFISFRNHRKIIVIDGKYAYTGGINIADEYVNKDEKYGYWKDAGIMISGSPVISYIVMFGKMYNIIKDKGFEYYHYIKQVVKQDEKEGFIMCIEDMPESSKQIVENMYINFIYSAKKNIYISTPYLILSDNMLNAIINAANSGVDVKIVVPMTPDKLPIYKVTKSYYKKLINVGVEIYEYSPGFIHSKIFLVDDIFSSCGSINMDFRSFDLNYECTTLTYDTLEEEKIKKDFVSMFKKSKKIKINEINKQSFFERIVEGLLGIFKQLM